MLNPLAAGKTYFHFENTIFIHDIQWHSPEPVRAVSQEMLKISIIKMCFKIMNEYYNDFLSSNE